MATMIPGLPEEIGMECLIRVPHDGFPLLQRVCRRWKKALESPLFHSLRHSAASSCRLLVLSQAQPAPSSAADGPSLKYSASLPPFRLTTLHPSSGEWAHLPPIPNLTRGLPLFCGLAATGTCLILVGGWDPETCAPSSAVYIFSFLSATWCRGSPMPGPRRSFFACAASPDGQVFVAGGHDEEKNALCSVMVYDVNGDNWAELPDMATERDECTGVFDANANLFRVVSGYCTLMQGNFERSAEAFDVGERRWRSVDEAAVEEGEYARTCIVGGDGKMYMCSGGGRAVAVKEGEGWRDVAEVPEDVRTVPRILAWGQSLVVVGTGSPGGAQSAYLMEMKPGAAAAWRRLDMTSEFSGHVQGGCCIEI